MLNKGFKTLFIYTVLTQDFIEFQIQLKKKKGNINSKPRVKTNTKKKT